jgi:hypothetical protein
MPPILNMGILALLALCIIYVIYTKTHESFSLQSNITDLNTAILNDIVAIDTKFANTKMATTDNGLFNTLFATTQNQKTAELTTLLDPQLQSIDSDISALQNELTQMMATMKVADSATSAGYLKSLQNGMQVCSEPIPDTFSNFVKFNDGCLTVPGSGDYKIAKCAANDVRQQFRINTITSKEEYDAAVESSALLAPNDATIRYPFTMVKSVNNENCLQNNNGAISVEPCAQYLSQRWKAIPKTVTI